MNNIEKISGLLEKRTLSEEEKLLLENIIESDQDAREFYNSYNKINQAVKAGTHLSYDEISGYILFLNSGEKAEDFSTSIQKIKEHLRGCSKCNEEFKLLNAEFADIENYIESLPIKKDEAEAAKHIPQKYNPLRYSFAALVLIGFVYIILYFISHNITSPYYDSASLKSSDEVYITRGRATDFFQESIKALDEDNYEEAISFLQKDISQNKNDETIFYSHYILGLTYLETAPKSFIGLFPKYEESRVINGIRNLNAAINKNTSGKFNNITLDAYFYLGKAHLMLEETEEAKKYLKLAADQKGSKMEQARQIIDELE